MKNLTILILATCTLSCSKNVEDSYGTKLASIDYSKNNKSWTENYSYNSNSELYQIEDLGTTYTRYEIQYENNRVKEFSTFRHNDGKLIFRDSIGYNENGTIKAIYNFSINSGEILSLSNIYEFAYNDENKVAKKSTYFVSSQKYHSIQKYFWKGDNIESVEHLNGDEELLYEYIYKLTTKSIINKTSLPSCMTP